MNTDTIAKLAISEADRAYCEAHQQAYAAMPVSYTHLTLPTKA